MQKKHSVEYICAFSTEMEQEDELRAVGGRGIHWESKTKTKSPLLKTSQGKSVKV